jgi:hypothetical protein
MTAVDTLAARALAGIEATLQTYFDGLYEGDTAKLAEAFHPFAHLYTVGPDGVATDLPLGDWLAAVATRPAPAASGLERGDRIVTVDQSGPTTAFAKVHCQIPPRYFTDYLSLVLEGGRWRVIAKSYTTETR